MGLPINRPLESGRIVMLTTSSSDFYSLKSIRRESWRGWGNILTCPFTCCGDEGRGGLEGIEIGRREVI